MPLVQHAHSTGQPYPITPPARVAAARRVQAARVLVGDRRPLRELARESGLSYQHLTAITTGREPLLDTDARDLGRVLAVPATAARRLAVTRY